MSRQHLLHAQKNSLACRPRLQSKNAHGYGKLRTARGIYAAKSAYSPNSTITAHVSFGRCRTCPRDQQVLFDGRCEDCRFYDDSSDQKTRSPKAKTGAPIRIGKGE